MGGIFKGFGVVALAVWCGLGVGHPAASQEAATDLPDLDERLAALEASVARTRGKPLAVRIAGLVHRAILRWDDGFEHNTYLVTNDNSPSRFTFATSTNFSAGWKAGYYLDIGAFSAGTFFINQNVDNYEELRVRYSFAFLESERLGRISLGQAGGAGSELAGVSYSVTSEVFSYYALTNVGASMYVRAADGGLSNLSWSRLIRDRGAAPGEAGRGNIVRYDTPVVSGFKASVTWGEDDFWDVGLRYTGKWGDFKSDTFLIYGENTESGDGSAIACIANASPLNSFRHDAHCRQGVGITSVMHEPTGLYVNFAVGRFHDERVRDTTAFAGTGAKDDSGFWATEIGIAHNWFGIGKTTIFGQHYEFTGGANARRYIEATDAINPFETTSRIFSTSVQSWSGGIVQSIADANMDLFVIYRHIEGHAQMKEGLSGDGALASPALEPLKLFLTGAIIRF